MNLLPYHTETLVSVLSKKEVLGHLMRVTREVNFMDTRTQGGPEIKFNGMIGQEGFRISRSIRRGETFLPLMRGKVESTPRGSIIFLTYQLFPGAIFFLSFWSIVLLGFTAFYFAGVKNYTYGSICLILGGLNYLLGIFFFQRQVKLSREVFHELINFQLKDKD
ncbi:hypothetical protein DFQ04_2092 [Algoriphagus boseongensis]|uniref:Uncharacterized protein n=1 Tax=Algoriphagus boseongensis TaxID=1442587 RepID=A0A4R6T5Z3_9BACT|nr:hypothetical protein [Algoriphagus boseongensis]TDQ17439.1 hypothetical protein DFQ04_2092 [Algoriphagus boseongensis]